MTFTVQVTFDARDPHELAAWWAETLRWEIEPQDEAFIRSMINQGHASEEDTKVWNGALVWRTAIAIRPTGESKPGTPRILFQEVPEDKSGKNRVHLDIRTGEDEESLDAIRTRLIERGATELYIGQEGPHTWTTMTDPEGNEFCI
jgi:Glyoxalase-like domain